jgi:hypothetical protein
MEQNEKAQAVFTCKLKKPTFEVGKNTTPKKAEVYGNLMEIVSSQITFLKEDEGDKKFTSQIEMRQGLLKSFESRLKEHS